MDIDDYRNELLTAASNRMSDSLCDGNTLRIGLFYEFSDRLTQAEEFTDVIPSFYTGSGSRGRKLRVDGYQLDEVDSSLRLVIGDFSGEDAIGSMTRSRAEGSFKQVQAFVEDTISERIWAQENVGASDIAELASLISSATDTIVRYRIYLLTDSVLSDRIRDLPESEISGIPVEYHIWDLKRLSEASASTLGLEEVEIDLSEFVPDGLPCLPSGTTDEYQGYLAVIPGKVLAMLYDRFGSRLLEGNVRAYLTARGKINKGIQGTIRAEPEKFFVYNNGISCTATGARVKNGTEGCRLISVKALQIVNGGQTTASLHTALRLDRADLSEVDVQMKLSVVSVQKSEELEDLIERIARYSNSQNKVSEADFFSNHPYHQMLERLSRRITAPAAPGAQFNTYWFYERARGQYQNAQLHLTPARRKEFQRKNPRAQMFVKTDVAKFENSWMHKPHIVSKGAQKNFSDFAKYIADKWGVDGKQFNNDGYFQDVVARTILFRTTEKVVSGASWYQTGMPRAQIVTYTIAKLSQLVSESSEGESLNFRAIWDTQGLPAYLERFIQHLGSMVCNVITSPPSEGMHYGEWAKKPDCWVRVKEIDVALPSSITDILVSGDELEEKKREQTAQGKLDNQIDAQTAVVTLGANYWDKLRRWTADYAPIYGMEADLVRNASNSLGRWIPSPKQASVLLRVMDRCELEGFRVD